MAAALELPAFPVALGSSRRCGQAGGLVPGSKSAIFAHRSPPSLSVSWRYCSGSSERRAFHPG